MNIIFYQNQLLVVRDGDNILLPDNSLVAKFKPLLQQLRLDSAGGILAVINELPTLAHLQAITMRQAMTCFSDDVLQHIVHDYQLHSYYLSHQYCGCCGHKTRLQHKNKFVYCDSCGQEICPHIAPCIMVRIHRGREILMARGVNFPPNSWGLLAGFVELGETLEQAVHREVKEEVGLRIHKIKFWGSQPWPFPSNTLMVAFTAEYLDGEIVIDPVEIEQAAFYRRDNIPGRPSNNYSIASRLIDEFIYQYS